MFSSRSPAPQCCPFVLDPLNRVGRSHLVAKADLARIRRLSCTEISSCAIINVELVVGNVHRWTFEKEVWVSPYT